MPFDYAIEAARHDGTTGSRERAEAAPAAVSDLDEPKVADTGPADVGQDGFFGGGPDEGSGAFVVHVHVFLDRGNQVGHAVKDAPAQRLVGQLSKPPFDQVQPRA